MRPADRDAGSRRRFLGAGLAALASLAAGCTPAARRPEGLLEQFYSITGARIATRMNVAGGFSPDAFGPYIPLMFPVAVAYSALYGDLYIADAGMSRLYRYDRNLDAMATMPETRIGPMTRLQTGPDGSIYVLDPLAAEIRRYTRAGQPLPNLRPTLGTSRYVEFAVDPLTTKVYAVDSGRLAIDEIQPLGQFASLHRRFDDPGPMAADGRSLYVAGWKCGCVTELIGAKPGRRFGAGKLNMARALAVDGPNIYAIDGADRSIAIVHEEGVDKLTPATLGLTLPEALAVGNRLLFVADGTGHRVTAFRQGMKRRT